ncbi:1b0d81d2-14d1-4b29-9e2b-5679f4cf2901 [Sclerotinia trifoliorum]|uniref:1b0d81d2-14d1-4b29-9e2b-5679f4cf2901 n=1 Tax=Sclerotinia trifoliorum TaxID=28548 RepID=A0A8H2ZRX9_9HELO|nr:1b0d81d2-14d1-4b29-9e2b-5679f4cf2901 [Sclerotinia trifoliorum]
MASAKRQEDNNGVAQTSSAVYHSAIPTMDDSTDDGDNYEQSFDPEEDGIEDNPAPSSSKKVTFDISANVTRKFKNPVIFQRRYIPDLDSLPKTGVWASVSPSRHTEFHQIVVRTTKCDYCGEKVNVQPGEESKVMQRCNNCNTQFCQKCVRKVAKDKLHFPVSADLVWDAQTKVNAKTRPDNNFKENMYTRKKPEPNPTRPLTASERLQGMRNIAPGTFNITVVNTPASSRPSHARPTKATKKPKNSKKSPNTAHTTEGGVDPHDKKYAEWVSTLSPAEQRKEKKEADMRNLLRKRTLEIIEEPVSYNAESPASEYQVRTPLPAAAKRHKIAPRSTTTPAATRRQLSGIPESTKNQYESSSDEQAIVAATGASGSIITSEPLRNILDGLANGFSDDEQLPQGMNEISDHSEEHIANPTHGEYNHQEYIPIQNDVSEEGNSEDGHYEEE